MAKVNPVMQHAKPKLTAEQVAIEDFMNTIPPALVRDGDCLADNTITEVIDHVDTSLDPIVESVVVADSLDELAGDVDGVTTAASMESYTRIFKQLTSMSGHPVASLEEFKPTKGGVKKLASSIRQHAELIRGCVDLSFEEYTDKVDESIGTTMSNYKQALGELNKLNQNIDMPDEEVVINHKAVWRLFHMNNELMDLRDFQVEVDGIKTLAEAVRKGSDRVAKMVSSGETGNALEGKEFVQLMNNTDVTIKEGRAHFEELPVPEPEKKWSAGDWFWVIIFGWAGVRYRQAKGGSGEEQTQKKQSIQAIHKVIDEMKKMGPVVDGIAKDAKRVIAQIEKAPNDKKADLKRAASPVLELASKTIQHVANITYGAKNMFEKM